MLAFKTLPTKPAFRVVKANAETPEKKPASATPAAAPDASGAALPEPLQNVADFFMREDFTLAQWDFYNDKLKQYVESDLYVKSTGWKEIPEITNGRLAMLGWLTGVLAEVLGAGSMYKQLAAGPQVIIVIALLITVASVVPVYRGVDDKKVKELFDQYTLPSESFTPGMEKFHGRVAMVAMVIFLLVEAFKGTPIL